MRGDGEWDAALIRCLADCGVDGTEAAALARDALAEAEDAGCGPRKMYGPAATYAQELARAFRAAPPSDTHLGIGPVVLRLSSVTKRYGRKPALRGVDLCLRAGQIAAVVGANGSGKSTLLDICAGLIRPTTGSVERVAHIGYAPQQHGVAPLLTPAEHFTLFGATRGMSRRSAIDSGMRLAGRLGWRPKPGLTAAQLSGGTQQKLNVVLAELDEPELLLLDEPYQGFDRGSTSTSGSRSSLGGTRAVECSSSPTCNTTWTGSITSSNSTLRRNHNAVDGYRNDSAGDASPPGGARVRLPPAAGLLRVADQRAMAGHSVHGDRSGMGDGDPLAFLQRKLASPRPTPERTRSLADGAAGRQADGDDGDRPRRGGRVFRPASSHSGSDPALLRGPFTLGSAAAGLRTRNTSGSRRRARCGGRRLRSPRL